MSTTSPKLGRPCLAIKKVEWTLTLPEPLAAELELLLYDPLLERVKVGARSKLVEELLRVWVDAQRKKERT